MCTYWRGLYTQLVCTHSGPDPHIIVAVTVLKENEIVNEENDVDQHPSPLQMIKIMG